MRVLILIEYLHPQPWSPTRWGVDLVRGLCARGHEVTVACDGAHDEAELAPASVLSRDPRRWRELRAPLAYRAFALRRLRHTPRDVSLSLTTLVEGDVWIPLGSPAPAMLRRAVSPRNPARLAMDATHQYWLPGACLAEWRAQRAGRNRGSVVARLAPRAGAGELALGCASRFDPPGPHAAAGLRARTRDLLGLPADRLAVAVSAAHASASDLAPMFEGLARMSAGDSRRSPVMLIAGHDALGAWGAADRAGCGRRVRMLGGTGRMDALLAAADLAACPAPARHRNQTARFMADALRLGVPVLGSAAAVGIEHLLAPGAEPAPGAIVPRHEGADWADALAGALDPEWRARAARAAQERSARLSMDGLIARLERVLATTAERRRAP